MKVVDLFRMRVDFLLFSNLLSLVDGALFFHIEKKFGLTKSKNSKFSISENLSLNIKAIQLNS